jgi:hypothetical protein
MAIQEGVKTAANGITEHTAKIDVYPVMFHIGESSANPLVAMLGGDVYEDGNPTPTKVPALIGKKETAAVKYDVVEKSPKAREVIVDGAVASTSEETVALDSQKLLTVGTTLKNMTTGEIMMVHTNTSATSVEVRRNLGGTTYQIANDAVLRVIGSAHTEGGPKRAIRSQLADARTRYVQIFKNSFGVTGTAQAIKYEVSPNSWDEEQEQTAIDHNLDREWSFWFNPAADSTTDVSGDTVNLTRGLLAEIRLDHDDIDVSSGLTEDIFFGTVSEQIFAYGPKRKIFLCDATMRSFFNGMAREKMMTKTTESKYGFAITEIDTGHGILEIAATSVFTANMDVGTYGFGVALDPKRLKYRFLPGRDSFLEKNTQTAGQDAKEAQFITECGLSALCLPHHSIVLG